MKRKKMPKNPGAGFPGTAILTPKEKKVLKSSIDGMNRQADALGLPDPLELEPVLVYSLAGRGK